MLQEALGGILTLPACEEHNGMLGSTVENWISEDYWIKFAKTKLNLKNLRLSSNFQFDGRSNRYQLLKMPDGSEKTIAPHTEKTTWRIIAKYLYCHLAFLIGNEIFKEEFDSLRDYILGMRSIDQKEWGVRCQKVENETNEGDWNIVRCSFSEIPLDPIHVIEFFAESGSNLLIRFYLFGFYMFACPIVYEVSNLIRNELPARIVIDLRNSEVIFGKLSADTKKWIHKSTRRKKRLKK